MYIKHVTITGFWGGLRVSTELPRDVAIFVGANGTGKTTLINLVVAALSVDFVSLAAWQFDQISIRLCDPENESSVESLRVRRVREAPSTVFEYAMGSKKYFLEADPRRRRIQTTLSEEGESWFHFAETSRGSDLVELRDRIRRCVNLSWVAVHRQVPVARDEDPATARQPAVDHRLKQMLDRLTKLQLRIESGAQELSKQFQSSVLSLLLYSPLYDTLDKAIQEASGTNLKAEEEDIKHAVRELGINVPTERITLHFNKLTSALKAAKAIRSGKADSSLNMEDVFALPMLIRTKSIMEELKTIEVRRDNLRHPLRLFIGVVQEFFEKKRLWLDSNTGELRFAVKQSASEMPIRPTDLSSGEKQLLILMLEVLLQEDKPAVLIADEPELSLHVTWQEKLLPALRKLNENAQIIVATHSPDIVGPYRKSIISMESISSESSK